MRSWSTTTRGLFLVVALVWGLNYIFVNVGLSLSGPLWLATMRAALGTLGSAAILAVIGRGGRTLDGRGRRDALLLGIPNIAVFFALWFDAARTVLPGVAAVVIYTYPLWVALLSAPVLSHRLSGRHWVSVGAGFLGVALISQVGALVGASVPLGAILELLGAALAWAVGTVVIQRRFRPEEMLEANLYQLIGATAALFALTLVLEPTPFPRFGPELYASVAWLGLLGTAVAYSVWFDLLGRTRAATLSAYLFVVPVVALVASALVFHERLSYLQIVGVVLVLASIYGIGAAPEPPELPATRGTEPR